jgi:hypothetical protein
MNWVLLSTSKTQMHKNLISSYLQTKNSNVVFIELQKDILEMKSSAEFQEKFEKICIDLENADFFVFFLCDRDSLSPFSLFLLGFARAKAIPLYFIGEKIEKIEPHSFFDVFLYKNEENFLDSLDKSFLKIEEEKQSKNARQKICEMGLAFSVDGFSQAIRDADTKICNVFLASELDFNGRDSLGTPLLNIAVRAENIDIVKKLLKKSVSIDAKSLDRGYSALMDAVWKSNLALVQLLIAAGSDVNFISDDGQSILVLATGVDNYDVCEALVKAGASCHLKDNMGMSALDYARLFKKEHLVALYEKGGV